MISNAACNPATTVQGNASADATRSLLAFRAGPPTCPVRGHASMIVEVSLEQIVGVLPERQLSYTLKTLTRSYIRDCFTAPLQYFR